MEPEHPLKAAFYIVLAALAGAITSLSFMSWRTMTRGEIFMTVFVGVAFAVFTVPWITIDILHLNNADTLRAGCALTYFGATFSNSVIPILIKRVKKWAAKMTPEEDVLP